MPYIESSMDEFLEVANEGLLSAKKKSVDELLAAAEKSYAKTLKTVGDCDDQLLIINNEGRKFNECVRTLSKVKKQYDQGKLTKKQYNEQFKAAMFLLKKNCKALQIRLGNIVNDAQAITTEELRDFAQFISGLKKIVTRIRKGLMTKPAKESYDSIRAALEGEFDLETLEEEEEKKSKKDKDDDEDSDDDDDKDGKKKKKDDSEDDFDGESLEDDDDDKKSKKDKDDDDDSDDDDDDKDDKKKKDKDKDDDDEESDDDDDDKDDDKDSDDDDDKDDKKKKKDKDDDDEDDKEDAKESAHVYASAVIDEALEITAEWGIDYNTAFNIAKENVNVFDYTVGPAMETYNDVYVHTDPDDIRSHDRANAIAAGVTLGAAAGASIGKAMLNTFISRVQDYNDMPKGARKDEYGFKLGEELLKKKALVKILKANGTWGRLPIELRMYVNDPTSIPRGKNGIPSFSNYKKKKK